MHKQIRENKDKISIGHQNCKVFDIINVKPCFNCGIFGHNGYKCQNRMTCLKCAGEHQTNKCNNENICCINCKYSNEKYNKKYDTNHVTIDHEKCEILKRKINQCIITINYIVKPSLPKFTGRVHNVNTEDSNITDKRVMPRTTTKIKRTNSWSSTDSVSTRSMTPSSSSNE